MLVFGDRFHSRPATTMRLVGLVALIVWQIRANEPATLSGRGLAITVMLAGASIGWLGWALRSDHEADNVHHVLGWSLFLMAACGGLLVGPSDAGPSNVFVFAAAFTAGALVGMPRAFLVALVAIVGLCISWVIYGGTGIGALAYSLGLLATTFAGAQRYDSTVRREQAELLLAQSQRSHEEQLRSAKLQESSRIAREIHDVLAHSLAGLTIQLEATAALIEGGADAATILPRVRRAHELARDGLRETRLAVGALRDGGTTVVPVASRIEALAGDFRASGGAIELVIGGERERLAGPAGDAAVRIVQEALTNVTKHSPSASVTVSVYAGTPLQVAVRSRVPAGAVVAHATLSASGGGYGIAGMRERTEELGGSFSAGPTSDGWLVEAELPEARP